MYIHKKQLDKRVVYYNKKKYMNLFKMTKECMEIKTFSQKINKVYKLPIKILELSIVFRYNEESVGRVSQ